SPNHAASVLDRNHFGEDRRIPSLASPDDERNECQPGCRRRGRSRTNPLPCAHMARMGRPPARGRRRRTDLYATQVNSPPHPPSHRPHRRDRGTARWASHAAGPMAREHRHARRRLGAVYGGRRGRGGAMPDPTRRPLCPPTRGGRPDRVGSPARPEHDGAQDRRARRQAVVRRAGRRSLKARLIASSTLATHCPRWLFANGIEPAHCWVDGPEEARVGQCTWIVTVTVLRTAGNLVRSTFRISPLSVAPVGGSTFWWTVHFPSGSTTIVSIPKSSSLDRYSVFPASVVATPSTLSCAKNAPVGSSWLTSVPTLRYGCFWATCTPAAVRAASAVFVPSLPTNPSGDLPSSVRPLTSVAPLTSTS